MDQARLLVFKAVAIATKTPVPSPETTKPVETKKSTSSNSSSESKGAVEELSRTVSQMQRPTGLASCRSALNLPVARTNGNDQNTRLKKARSSALRLNNVLHGKSTAKTEGRTAPLGERIRSVRFDGGVNGGQPSALKKPRVNTASKLKSFKSFGRPHASDFDSGPRNATFGEYGGRQALWGRDGRMVHHPTPMQNMTGNEFAGIPMPDRNATFDLQQPVGAGQSSSGGSNASSTPSRMPRTATALENWFLNATNR